MFAILRNKKKKNNFGHEWADLTLNLEYPKGSPTKGMKCFRNCNL